MLISKEKYLLLIINFWMDKNEKITLIVICLIITLIGVVCVITAGSLTKMGMNNTSTNKTSNKP